MKRLTAFLTSNWALVGIVTGGLLLRLYKLTTISLWHDEAFSALLIKYSWSEMMYRIGLDVHPPMYYIFLRFWHYILGDSLLSLRGMSVFFGVATIIAAYYLIKEVFGNKTTALIAALLVAVNPFQVQYVTEARMYTMGAFFGVLAAYFLVRALRAQKKRYLEHGGMDLRKTYITYYVLFALSSGIMMLTHYYLLFSVAGLGLYGLWYHFRQYGFQFKKYGWLVLSGLLMGLTFLPWIKIFLFQYGQVGAGYWIPPMDKWSIPKTLYDLLIRIAEPSHILLVVLTIVTVWLIIRVLRKYQQPEKWLILGTFVAPFVGAILFFILARLKGQTSSVYLVRYFIFASTFYLMLWALFIQSFQAKYLKNILIVLLVGLNLFSIGYYWYNMKIDNKPGMAAAAAFLNANVEPQHKLYVDTSFQFFNFKYYNKTGLRPLLYTNNNRVENLPHFAGTAILTNDDLLLNWNDQVKNGDTVWVLWTTAFGGSDPKVPANWTEVDEKGYEDVRPYGGTWIIVTQYKVN